MSAEKQKEPSNAEIEKLAYSLFENEGRPHGKSLEFWLRAKAILSKEKEETKKQKRTKKTENAVS
jgi:uncharacterized protein YqgQ